MPPPYFHAYHYEMHKTYNHRTFHDRDNCTTTKIVLPTNNDVIAACCHHYTSSKKIHGTLMHAKDLPLHPPPSIIPVVFTRLRGTDPVATSATSDIVQRLVRQHHHFAAILVVADPTQQHCAAAGQEIPNTSNFSGNGFNVSHGTPEVILCLPVNIGRLSQAATQREHIDIRITGNTEDRWRKSRL